MHFWSICIYNAVYWMHYLHDIDRYFVEAIKIILQFISVGLFDALLNNNNVSNSYFRLKMRDSYRN